tara:strand:- start:750 stop:1478 length:729 start_codon:yes stop_codon:yes gene_type:complete
MRNIIITGSSGSIGLALISFFSRKKFNVIAVDSKSLERNKKLKNVDYFVCDLSNNLSQKKLFSKLEKKYKTIHVLLNVAGRIHNSLVVKRLGNTFKYHSYNNWKKVFNDNLNTSFLSSIYCTKLMMKDNMDKVIVNFSSVSANGNIGQVAYSSAKSAIETMTKVMAMELSIFNIRVVAISPGYFDTISTKKNMSDKEILKVISKTPSRRIGNKKELIHLVDTIVNNKFMNGKTYKIDGGLEI